MSHAKNQHARLVSVIRWALSDGQWERDAYPHTWRTTDRRTAVRYDEVDGALIIDHRPVGLAWSYRDSIGVESVDMAVDVLAAIGLVPVELSPMYEAGARLVLA